VSHVLVVEDEAPMRRALDIGLRAALTVEDTPGGGATLVFTFPAAP